MRTLDLRVALIGLFAGLLGAALFQVAHDFVRAPAVSSKPSIPVTSEEWKLPPANVAAAATESELPTTSNSQTALSANLLAQPLSSRQPQPQHSPKLLFVHPEREANAESKGESLPESVSTTAPIVPPDLAITVMKKVLVFDRSFHPSVTDGIHFGVVFDSESVVSRACADAFVLAFDAQSANQTKHHAAQAIPQAELANAIGNGVDVAWFCDGTGSAHTAVGVRDSTLITFTSDEAAVTKGDIAIGIVARNGNPKLLLHAAAARHAGIDLDPGILRLMEFVDGTPAAVAMP